MIKQKVLEKQLEFEFIEKIREQEKQSQLELIIGGFACAIIALSASAGLFYLKIAKPEVLENIKAFLGKIYPTYPGPY